MSHVNTLFGVQENSFTSAHIKVVQGATVYMLIKGQNQMDQNEETFL